MVPSRYMGPWHAKRIPTLADDAPASTRGHFLAPLLAMEGRFDEARSQLEGARAYLVERGMSFRLGAITLSVACVEFLAEDYEAAQRELESGIAILTEMGETGVLSTLAAMQAKALYLLGRREDMNAAIARAQQTGAVNDIATQAEWRYVAAMAAADDGRLGGGGATHQRGNRDGRANRLSGAAR